MYCILFYGVQYATFLSLYVALHNMFSGSLKKKTTNMTPSRHHVYTRAVAKLRDCPLQPNSATSSARRADPLRISVSEVHFYLNELQLSNVSVLEDNGSWNNDQQLNVRCTIV